MWKGLRVVNKKESKVEPSLRLSYYMMKHRKSSMYIQTKSSLDYNESIINYYKLVCIFRLVMPVLRLQLPHVLVRILHAVVAHFF